MNAFGDLIKTKIFGRKHRVPFITERPKLGHRGKIVMFLIYVVLQEFHEGAETVFSVFPGQ